MKIMKLFIYVMLLTLAMSGGFVSKSEAALRIALIAPLGEAGEALRNATEMAVEEINKDGGILNEKIKVYFVTEGRDVNKYQADLTQTIERDRCKILVGGFSSGKVLPAMKVMKAKKVLWLGTGGAHPQVVKNVADDPGMKYYFRVGYLDSGQQGKALADTALGILKPKGLTKVAFIRLNLPYSLEIIKPARERLKKAGFQVMIEDEAVKINADDFSAFLDECQAKGVQSIVASFLLGETVNFIKQFAAKGLNKKIAFLGALGMMLKDEFPEQVGGPEIAAYTGTVSPQVGPVDMTGDGAAIKFSDAYKARYGKSPYFIAYPAYDAFKILRAAATRAGSLKVKKLMAVMESDDFEFSGAIRYKWKKENHDLYVGDYKGKRYAECPYFQWYPDGRRWCVFPQHLKQKPFLLPGQMP
ncbi:MAG: ABC transporter substrate-binding protein [Deltaproteobacteria bacterium]|nr:ABC transporter substrate-binding protein [Deltaproteobacteria bacterium]